MFEVFDSITGETIGYTDNPCDVILACLANPRLDFINADEGW